MREKRCNPIIYFSRLLQYILPLQRSYFTQWHHRKLTAFLSNDNWGKILKCPFSRALQVHSILSVQFGKETSKTADSESLIAGQLCVLWLLLQTRAVLMWFQPWLVMIFLSAFPPWDPQQWLEPFWTLSARQSSLQPVVGQPVSHGGRRGANKRSSNQHTHTF